MGNDNGATQDRYLEVWDYLTSDSAFGTHDLREAASELFR